MRSDGATSGCAALIYQSLQSKGTDALFLLKMGQEMRAEQPPSAQALVRTEQFMSWSEHRVHHVIERSSAACGFVTTVLMLVSFTLLH